MLRKDYETHFCTHPKIYNSDRKANYWNESKYKLIQRLVARGNPKKSN